MANSPARRLTPKAPPAPLNLASPAVPSDPTPRPSILDSVEGEIMVPREQDPTTERVFGEVMTPVEEQDFDAGDLTPEAFMDAAAQLVSDIFTATDDPIIQAIEVMTNVITDRLNALTEAVNIIGQQQQWTTDTIGKLKEEFDRVMGSGNPMKMIGALMGAGKGKVQ